MRPSQFQLARDVHDGLLSVLTGLAFPDGQVGPYAVITTAPSQWTNYASGHSRVLLDVSGLIGPSLWWKESDLYGRAVHELGLAGWPGALVKSEYGAGPEERIRPDLLLVDRSGQAVAAIEVKSTPSPGVEEQLKHLSQSLGVRVVLLYDGAQILDYDCATGRLIPLSAFPSPKDLGVLQAGLLEMPPQSGAHREVEYARTPDELASLVRALPEKTALIIDHTMPWGGRSSLFEEMVSGALRPVVTDFLSGLVAFVTGLDPKRRLVFIVPRGFSFSEKVGALREYIASRLGVAAVVELPAGVFAPSTAVLTSVIAAGRFSDRPASTTVMTSLASLGQITQADAQSWFSDLKSGLCGSGVGSSYEVSIPTGATWSVAAYRPEASRVEARLKAFGNVVRLGEICDIIGGWRYPRSESAGGTAVPVVRGRDVGSAVISKRDILSVRTHALPSNRLRLVKGDVLLQRIGSMPKCGVVTESLAGAVAGDTAYVLRVKDDRLDPAMLEQYLRSPVAQTLLASAALGGQIPHLTLTSLRDMPVPLIDQDTSDGLRGLESTVQDLRAHADRLEALRLDLFGAESPEDLGLRLQAMRQQSRAVTASASRAEDLGYQIRELFPYPLAFAYRDQQSQASPDRKYDAQLRVAESILAFLGSLALALVTREGLASAEINLVQLCRGGVDLGTWRTICQKLSKTSSLVQAGHLGTALIALWQGKNSSRFYKTVERMVSMKNDKKHDRGPKTTAEIQTATGVMDELLSQCLHHLRFLTEYPIRLVCEVKPIRGAEPSARLKVYRCTGDHPALPVEEVVYRSSLPQDDLYVQVSENDWRSLFPFMTAHECCRCHHREIYFIDKWNGVGQSAVLKSFEQGHTLEADEEGVALAKV